MFASRSGVETTGPWPRARDWSKVDSAIRWVGVVVPARNESELLPGCLERLTVAAGAVDVPVRIVVVLDDCTDDSGRICAQRGIQTFQICARNVGLARATGFNGLIGHEAWPSSVWLATTDADTLVDPTWIRDQLQLASSGTDVVIGVVRLRHDGILAERRLAHEAAYARLFAGDDSHRHVHGANLGIRASVYLRAGGFQPLTNHEDRHLVQRLQNLDGVTIVTSRSISVATSSRSHGRCEQGFAATLARVPH
jgi:cellulose synthase/poly-beta-1,6-N-acetylglucosamine synthase-like glycosyltransferase